MENINNLRVASFVSIASPDEVMQKVPITPEAVATVVKGRGEICDILDGKDKRKIVIVGPCSIHDTKAALEYAEKLNDLRKRVENKLVLVMRVYLEKPRTTIGWKGFIYDPFLDDSYSLKEGVVMGRDLLVKINSMGLPTATEVLGPIVIQYYSDLICWSAIGARTAESQTHRELSSGLSMPVGFKNGTEGNLDVAVNAIVAARSRHSFLGMDDSGMVAVVNTTGNPYGHIILRGGNGGPNYSAEDVARAVKACEEAGVGGGGGGSGEGGSGGGGDLAEGAGDLRVPRMGAKIIVDCSHANSEKDFRNQAKVWRDVWGQIRGRVVDGSDSGGAGDCGGSGNGSDVSDDLRVPHIVGLMLESNLFEGSQKIGGGWGELKYGVSVTDGCIGWEETERLIMEAVEG